MTLVRALKRVFTDEKRILWLCDACGGTFVVAPGTDEPRCSVCGSAEVRWINHV